MILQRRCQWKLPVWQAIFFRKPLDDLRYLGVINVVYRREQVMRDMIVEATHKKPDEPVVFRNIVGAAELVNEPWRWHVPVLVRDREFAFGAGMRRQQYE